MLEHLAPCLGDELAVIASITNERPGGEAARIEACGKVGQVAQEGLPIRATQRMVVTSVQLC